MQSLEHISQMLALTMGVAWASGINLYATLFMLDYLANTSGATLPPVPKP